MDFLQKPFVDMFFETFSTNESIIWGLVALFYLTFGVYTAKIISTNCSEENKKLPKHSYENNDISVEGVAIIVFLLSPVIVAIVSIYCLGYFLTSKKSREIEKELRGK